MLTVLEAHAFCGWRMNFNAGVPGAGTACRLLRSLSASLERYRSSILMYYKRHAAICAHQAWLPTLAHEKVLMPSSLRRWNPYLLDAKNRLTSVILRAAPDLARCSERDT